MSAIVPTVNSSATTILPGKFSYDESTGVCYRELDFLDFIGYRIGDDGSLWSRWYFKGNKGRILGTEWRQIGKGANCKRPWLSVNLVSKSGIVPIYIHTLVLTAFVGPCPENMECCHSPDPNPRNNRLTNLRWDTHENNQRDNQKHGSVARGSKIPQAKLTETDVQEIRRLYETGEFFQRELAVMFRISQSVVSTIISRKWWKHVKD